MRNETVRYIIDIFIGDTDEGYSRKSGPNIFAFFNNHFGFDDVYSWGKGYPSRWAQVQERIAKLGEDGLNKFLNVILSEKYIRNDLRISLEDAVMFKKNTIERINNQLDYEDLKLSHNGTGYEVHKKLKYQRKIDNGGFANIFLDSQSNIVTKALKRKYLSSKSIKSRFKREFQIMQDLKLNKGINNVIDVFNLNLDDYSYQMPLAEMNVYDYIVKQPSEANKLILIKNILKIFNRIHKTGVIHRDVSPENILIFNGKILICDFGLAKDFELKHSHQTQDTNALGRLDYTAPEVIRKLSAGNIVSDIYSIGKLINFIMREDPNDFSYPFAYISSRATKVKPNNRYESVEDMLSDYNEYLKKMEEDEYEQEMNKNIMNGLSNYKTQNYVLTSGNVNTYIKHYKKVNNIIIDILEDNTENSYDLTDTICNGFRDVCGTWKDYDNFGYLADDVIRNKNINYNIKIGFAILLRTVAFEINRFDIQRVVEKLKKSGIEPSIEDYLTY